MIVCAHGNVLEYCKSRGLIIVDRWDGDFRDYDGMCPILVTDVEITEQEYYIEKSKLLARGIELVSTRYEDNAQLATYIALTTERGGTKKRKTALASEVIDRIKELRAEGMTIRDIQVADGVCHPDGRRLSISYIHKILQKG
jgi:hypothetical protein